MGSNLFLGGPGGLLFHRDLLRTYPCPVSCRDCFYKGRTAGAWADHSPPSSTDMIRYICSLQLGSHPVAVVQYTFTHKKWTEWHKQYIERHKNFGRVRADPHLCGFYPGICLTNEEKARKSPSQGSWIMPAGMKKMLRMCGSLSIFPCMLLMMVLRHRVYVIWTFSRGNV